jgi:hypothetical protein
LRRQAGAHTPALCLAETTGIVNYIDYGVLHALTFLRRGHHLPLEALCI